MGLSARDLLLELLDRGFDKVSWHGANLMGALRGVDAAGAARSFRGRKSVWEQALHAAYWKQRVINRLVGTQKFGRKGGNWPPLPAKVTEAAWREDLRFLQETHRRLRESVAGLDLRRVDARVLRMIHGVAFHDVYHAGQIKLLRRLMDNVRGVGVV
jgi:hypothetical protein